MFSRIIRFKVKIDEKENTFFGNPDSMASEIGLENGYRLEREIIGVGPVKYEKAIIGSLNKKINQSHEGLAMDLINQLWPLKDIKWDEEEQYYLPKSILSHK